MTAVRLQARVLKDVVEAAPPEGATTALRILSMSMLPLNLYLRIDVPLLAQADAGERQILRVHVLGPPGAEGATPAFFAFVGLGSPPRPLGTAPASVRRMLVLVSHADSPDGPYRVVLQRDGTQIAAARLTKTRAQIRVADKAPLPPAAPVAPVLLSGTPKSGTTWLEKIVDAHPDFLVLHEAHTLSILDEGLLREQLESQREVLGRRTIPWLPDRFDASEFGRFLQVSLARELMARFGRAWGAAYVADRTPGYAPLYPVLPDIWEDLRIIHVIRHPLDVMVSWMFHELNAVLAKRRSALLPRPMLDELNARIDTGTKIDPGHFVSDEFLAGGGLRPLTRRWSLDQKAAQEGLARHPRRIHVVGYEDLGRDFARTVGRLFAFLGTDPARTDVAAIEAATSFRAMSGGRAPGEAKPRSFFRKGIAGDWRHVFTPAQARMLWVELSEAAAPFGYAMDDAPARLGG